MLIDSHAHLNFNAFKEDKDKVIKECLENDIWMVNIGSKYDNSKEAIDIASRYDQGVYAVVGLHPINLDTGLLKMKDDSSETESRKKEAEFDYDKYRELAKSEKVVAVGEAGLDYYWRPKTTKKKELFKQKQKDLFLKELDLAEELDLPVVLHCRMAHKDLIEILSEKRPKKAVAHGFVGNSGELQRYLDFGFFVGFNGIIFKEIEGIDFKENIWQTPLEKILIETDCPYLNPPYFHEERNTPLSLKYIANEIATVKGVSLDKITKATTGNARELFGI